MPRYGYIREQKDIRYLILFCMSFLPFAISEADLLEVVFVDDGFGYFEFSEAFHALLEQGLIAEVDTGAEKQYILTGRAQKVLEVSQNELRQSVRDKAQAAAIRVVRKIERDATIKTGHTENEDGTFNVTLEITGSKGLVAGVNMMVFTPRQCTLLEENFRKNAEHIYQQMITLLLSDGSEKKEGQL